MASKLLATLVLVCACRSGERSTAEPPPRPRDGGLRKVALARPDDDTVAFERSTFKARDLNCKPGTSVLRQSPNDYPPDLPRTIDAFAIDRRTVSCFDFDRCIESDHCGGSSRLSAFPTVAGGNVCTSGAAIVTHDAAEAYCRWRGMSLPSLFQWQRAIRGTAGMEFPGGHEFDPNKMELRELASPDGVIYSTEGMDNDEWLRDRDCTLFTKEGKVEKISFAAMQLGPRINYWYGPLRARFRCVRPAVAAEPHDGGLLP